jgi:RNA polymerase sigma-70 factor, ECF subfamily
MEPDELLNSLQPSEDPSAAPRQRVDDRAFADMLAESRKRLFSFALRRVGERDLAGDLTAQVVSRAWNSRRTYDSTRPFIPWLLAIARNAIRSHFRDASAQKRCSKDDGRAESIERIDSSPSAGEEALRIELRSVIRSEVNSLEVPQRSLIDRFYTDGQSISEIASALGRTESSVESELHRIREKLRRKLAPRLSSMGYCVESQRASRETSRDSN